MDLRFETIRTTPAALRRVRSVALFSLGLTCSLVLCGALAESFLRWFPPSDLKEYLDESPRQTGGFRAHSQLGVAYRSWESFQRQNQEHLAQHLPLMGHPDQRPVWAFFGNSFIQAPGMLGDVVRDAVPTKRILYLKRNELLPVRLAQIELLLDEGLRPERVFVELMPIDTLPLVRRPLDSYRVTSSGALTFRPRLPPGIARWPVEQSRLAFTAWIRSGLHERSAGELCRRIDATLRGDLDRMFGHLARVTRSCGVPVTVILIPAHEQSVGDSPFAFNDSVTELLTAHGFDVIDPRDRFTAHDDPHQLYIPDKHLSSVGNRLLLGELLRRHPSNASIATRDHQQQSAR